MRAPQSNTPREAMRDPQDALNLMMAIHEADVSPDGLFSVRLSDGRVYRGKVVKPRRRRGWGLGDNLGTGYTL